MNQQLNFKEQITLEDSNTLKKKLFSKTHKFHFTQNKKPVLTPIRCGANELLYPGDDIDDWMCDCKPGIFMNNYIKCLNDSIMVPY